MPTTRDAFDEAIERYCAHITAERGLSPHTVSAYRRDLHRFATFIRDRQRGSPGEVTHADVQDFLVHLGTGDAEHPGLASASVARALAALRALLAFEVEEGRVMADPSREVPAPVLPSRLPKAIPYEQVVALLQAARAQPNELLGLRDAALLELLYGTGARVSELTDLDLDDLDDVAIAAAGSHGESQPSSSTPGASQVNVLLLHGKGGKERLVPYGHVAHAALGAYLVRARPALSARGTFSPALFLNARGGRLSRQNAYKILQGAAQRTGLDIHVSPHTLRHSFATHLLDGGADVRVVQELLGHSSVTTTQIYTLITPARVLAEYRTSHPRARKAGLR